MQPSSRPPKGDPADDSGGLQTWLSLAADVCGHHRGEETSAGVTEGHDSPVIPPALRETSVRPASLGGSLLQRTNRTICLRVRPIPRYIFRCCTSRRGPETGLSLSLSKGHVEGCAAKGSLIHRNGSGSPTHCRYSQGSEQNPVCDPESAYKQNAIGAGERERDQLHHLRSLPTPAPRFCSVTLLMASNTLLLLLLAALRPSKRDRCEEATAFRRKTARDICGDSAGPRAAAPPARTTSHTADASCRLRPEGTGQRQPDGRRETATATPPAVKWAALRGGDL
ncbi:hypothetical protein GN956_G3701 [Arapaima gigas]